MNGLNIDTVFDFVALVSWIITLYVIGRAFWRSLKEVGVNETLTLKKGGWILSKNVILSTAASVIVTLIAMAVVFIEPQENAVVVSALSRDGIRENSFDAGLHVVVPFLERPVHYPIYKQSFSISRSGFERGEPGVDDSISARSKEGQEVFVDATLVYRIDPTRLNEVHIAWQERYLQQFVRPLVRSTTRTAASQLTVEEIYSEKRLEMQLEILESLTERLESNGFLAENYLIRDVSFKPDYAAAVEAKVITEQEALRSEIAIRTKTNEAEQIRQLAQGEADAVVIKAGADAAGLELVNEVLQENPDVLNYEYIKRLAPNVRLLMLDSGNPVILPLSTDLTGGDPAPANPLIPQMPPSGLAPDGNGLEGQIQSSGLAGDGQAETGSGTSPADRPQSETASAEREAVATPTPVSE